MKDTFKKVQDFSSDIKKIDRFIHGWYGCHIVSNHFFQMWFWRFHFHVFFNPDPANILHDHAWPFWTFPLRSYEEDVLIDDKVVVSVVKSWRWHYRPSSHAHRYRGAVKGKYAPTIVWVGKKNNTGYRFMEIKDGKAIPLSLKKYMRNRGETDDNQRRTST